MSWVFPWQDRFICKSQQHTTTHCNTLQHTATHCNTMQITAAHYNTLQHTATYCDTLHHTATYCNILQHTATHSRYDAFICEVSRSYVTYTATYCNILQHTATYCNTWHIHLWSESPIRDVTFLFICDIPVYMWHSWLHLYVGFVIHILYIYTCILIYIYFFIFLSFIPRWIQMLGLFSMQHAYIYACVQRQSPETVTMSTAHISKCAYMSPHIYLSAHVYQAHWDVCIIILISANVCRLHPAYMHMHWCMYTSFGTSDYEVYIH